MGIDTVCGRHFDTWAIPISWTSWTTKKSMQTLKRRHFRGPTRLYTHLAIHRAWSVRPLTSRSPASRRNQPEEHVCGVQPIANAQRIAEISVVGQRKGEAGGEAGMLVSDSWMLFHSPCGGRNVSSMLRMVSGSRKGHKSQKCPRFSCRPGRGTATPSRIEEILLGRNKADTEYGRVSCRRRRPSKLWRLS